MKLEIKLGVLSAANVGIAFLFQWYVLIQLGPGVDTDALFAGMTIPQLVLAVISGSLMHVLVPLLSGESDDRRRHDAWGFLVLIGGLFGLLAVLLYIAAPWWVPLTVPGFDEAAQALTVELTRIQLVGMVFAAINGVQWATYHARQQFLWAESTSILASAFAFLLLIWALPRFGVIAAAWISTLRMGLQALLLAPGMGHPVRPDLKSPVIREAWQRIKPLLWGTAYCKTGPLVDRFLLSGSDSGSLSLYYLAQQIYGAVSQIFISAMIAPLVPVLSRLHKKEGVDACRRLYRWKLLQVGTISLSSLMVLGVFGQALLNLLAGHGNVSASNVELLWWIMICLGGMFFGGVVGQIATSTFYAFGDTRTVVRMATLTYTVHLPVKVLAFHMWGTFGLAVSTTLYVMANMSLLMYMLEKNKFSKMTKARDI